MQKKIMRDNAHRIIMTYVFVGGLWILFSDALLKSLSTDPVIITRIAVLKGWFFVFFTAVLLYIMIKKNLYEIKRAHLKISFSEEKFAKAFQKSPDLIALTRFSDGVFIDVNEQFLSKFALSRDKVIGKSAADLNMWLEIIQQPVYRKVLKEEKSIIDLEIKGRSKQGKTEVFLVSAEFLLLEETEYLLIVSREITKQKRTEEKIKKLNRLYALISQINQMLVRCREKELLYSEACHTIEEFGRYKYVFISLIDGENVFFKSADDNSRAEGIFAGMLHPENIGESRPDIFAEAMVTGNLVVINNIEEQSDITWKAQAFSAGWSSVISLPLKIEGIKSGAVNIFSSEENLFDEAEIKLLEEVASDISFAVNNIMQEEKHRLAEAALHKSEERFRVLFQSDIIGIIIADIQGNITEANDVFLKLTGYSREELPLCWKEMLPEDYRQLEKQTDGEFARNKRTLPWEREFIRKDGLPVPVLVGTAALKDNDNTVIGFVLDLRERKLAEEALRENEAALSGFFNAKDVLMCVLELDDTDFVYLLPNAKMAQMFGFEIAEMAGSRGRELGLSEAGAELWCSYMKKSLATGETVTFEHLINYRGKETWFISSISLIEDNSSPRPRFSFTASDITERKKAERELEQYKHHLENTVEERTQKLKEVNSLLQGEVIKLKLAEEEIQDQLNFLQILLDTIPNPIFFKNTESRYVDCNRSFAEFFDIPRHIIKNREVYEIFPQEIALRDNENDQILLKTSQAQLIELNYTNKYGNQKDIIINKAIFPKSDGSIGGIVGVVIDITEQKRLETEIKKALDKEKELVELKSGFISTASHEFRTPLTSILASSDLLEMFGRSWKEEKYFEHIKKIHNGVQYMTELLDDVLTVSKAETGRLECNPVQINLYRLCCDILEHVKVRKTGGHELNFDFPNISFTVGLDEKLVKHILLNLLSNAVKYSPDGGKIDFCVDVKENKVIFIIRDEGIGIGEEDMKNLFEPFHRGSNIGNISGTGLGLSIVKKSVELHKGTISVKSSLGKGTEFVIAIPYKKDIQQ